MDNLFLIPIVIIIGAIIVVIATKSPIKKNPVPLMVAVFILSMIIVSILSPDHMFIQFKEGIKRATGYGWTVLTLFLITGFIGWISKKKQTTQVKDEGYQAALLKQQMMLGLVTIIALFLTFKSASRMDEIFNNYYISTGGMIMILGVSYLSYVIKANELRNKFTHSISDSWFIQKIILSLMLIIIGLYLIAKNFLPYIFE